MRMRKKSWAIPFLNEHNELVINEPNIFKGKWNEKLKRSVIHLEIGTGKGDYIKSMSQMYIEDGWIGIEKETNVAAVAAKKLCENPIENRLLIAKDAKDILEWFDDGEIDIIHLNFSDPWPKSSNKKRRLSHKNFIDLYSKILKEDGKIIMKSDNSGLFEYTIIEFTHNGYEIEEISVDYRRNTHDEDAITEYEAKFIDLNQPIYRVVFKKIGE
ncbi:MAG: tRNA (guanosine(46)-N7)-methyltransferase TrmB [Erysipelotrichaceae bacterium]|nr:tRNA (guanosine(46)-N7)-methyltransferase TrmB [Erysipelotrichaceae bacterium]